MITRTTTALLEDLVDPANEEVWREFDARYRPILVAFGRRLGLTAEDAADAAQETLVRFVSSYRQGRFDRTRGRLRSWIIGIARHCIMDIHNARATRRERRGISAVDEVPDEDGLVAIWDAERDEAILARGIEELRARSAADPRTLEAFERVALRQQRPADVAEQLGMTPNDVYLAKHRCLKRLREIVTELESLYEVPPP
jgi:RNA polymerase sigma factor (sigma-70 family)